MRKFEACEGGVHSRLTLSSITGWKNEIALRQILDT